MQLHAAPAEERFEYAGRAAGQKRLRRSASNAPAALRDKSACGGALRMRRPRRGTKAPAEERWLMDVAVAGFMV